MSVRIMSLLSAQIIQKDVNSTLKIMNTTVNEINAEQEIELGNVPKLDDCENNNDDYNDDAVNPIACNSVY